MMWAKSYRKTNKKYLQRVKQKQQFGNIIKLVRKLVRFQKQERLQKNRKNYDVMSFDLKLDARMKASRQLKIDNKNFDL